MVSSGRSESVSWGASSEASWRARRALIEHHLARLLTQDAVLGADIGWIGRQGGDVNVAVEQQFTPAGAVVRADSPPRRLRRAEIDAFLGVGVSGFLVEDQAARHEMYGVLQFLGRGLIGMGRQGAIALQVDINCPLANHLPGLRLIEEVTAGDLVETVRLAAVDYDLHVPQFGAAALFVLGGALRPHGKQGMSTLRFREGETLGVLLHPARKLSRQFGYGAWE